MWGGGGIDAEVFSASPSSSVSMTSSSSGSSIGPREAATLLRVSVLPGLARPFTASRKRFSTSVPSMLGSGRGRVGECARCEADDHLLLVYRQARGGPHWVFAELLDEVSTESRLELARRRRGEALELLLGDVVVAHEDGAIVIRPLLAERRVVGIVNVAVVELRDARHLVELTERHSEVLGLHQLAVLPQVVQTQHVLSLLDDAVAHAERCVELAQRGVAVAAVLAGLGAHGDAERARTLDQVAAVLTPNRRDHLLRVLV